jgi:hypothetical protein
MKEIAEMVMGAALLVGTIISKNCSIIHVTPSLAL